MGRWNWSFLLGTARYGCRFVSVLSWLLAGGLVSLSAFALAGGRVQVGRARVWVGTVAWSYFCFLSSVWLFCTSEPVISVVSIGHFQIRAFRYGLQ